MGRYGEAPAVRHDGQLPLEYEESARVDGASRLTVLVRIVLPLAKPALATLTALTFLDSWNNFCGR